MADFLLNVWHESKIRVMRPKVIHHTKKVLESLEIKSVNEGVIDLVAKNLRLRHKEYELESLEQLKYTVSEILNGIFSTNVDVCEKVFL
jgi:hypothetical protein